MAKKLVTVAFEDEGVVVTISLPQQLVEDSCRDYPHPDMERFVETNMSALAENLSRSLRIAMRASGANIAHIFGLLCMAAHQGLSRAEEAYTQNSTEDKPT